jgi:hypothetical protein
MVEQGEEGNGFSQGKHERSWVSYEAKCFEFSITDHRTCLVLVLSQAIVGCYMPGEMRDEIPTARSKLEEAEAEAFWLTDSRQLIEEESIACASAQLYPNVLCRLSRGHYIRSCHFLFLFSSLVVSYEWPPLPHPGVSWVNPAARAWWSVGNREHDDRTWTVAVRVRSCACSCSDKRSRSYSYSYAVK